MENEDDENSAYHPHDLNRYCQFCLDRYSSCTAALGVERHFTINPVIPLIDPIYDHVIKKYPKRSYCILRNCVKVSDLINCPKSTVFELLRPEEDPLKLSSGPSQVWAQAQLYFVDTINNLCKKVHFQQTHN